MSEFRYLHHLTGCGLRDRIRSTDHAGVTHQLQDLQT